MSKILPIASAFLAATTLWGQLEPVGVNIGETVRLNATARALDSCAAQTRPGAVPKEPGPGSSSCKTDVLNNNEKKTQVVPNEAAEPEAKPDHAKPAGGAQEGIKVHGHWIIDIRNPDGTLATHREFENSLTTTGAAGLSSSLGRTGVIGLWYIVVQGGLCPAGGGGGACLLVEATETLVAANFYKTLVVSAPTSGVYNGDLVLSGNFTAPVSGAVSQVFTEFDFCASGTLPANCTASVASAIPLFTAANYSQAIIAGQFVQVTVVISFM